MAAGDIERRRLIERDAAPHSIDRPGDQGAEDDRQQHPILQREVSGQGEEVEADVRAVDRITLAIGDLEQEAQDHVPVAHLRPGNQKPEDEPAAPAIRTERWRRAANPDRSGG